MRFLFSSGNSPLAALIRWSTGSDVSHCAIGVQLCGVEVVIEATILGVEMTTWDRWRDDHRLICAIEVPDTRADGALPTYLKALGEGYDYSGLFGYFPIFIARWLKRRIRNPLASPTRTVCSELLVRGMVAQRPNCSVEWLVLDPETATPRDVLETCKLLRWDATRFG